MAVVVNEFEVVSAPPPQQQTQAPAVKPPPPDPALAEEELERALRTLHARAARLHAC